MSDSDGMVLRARPVQSSQQKSDQDLPFAMDHIGQNKIGDVNVKKEQKLVTSSVLMNNNKVSDFHSDEKSPRLSPSISSEDSCTKLTMSPENENPCCGNNSVARGALKLGICTVCGIFFGIMFVKGRVFEPKSIRGQMVFENFIMLKMFLSAVCVGQVIFSIMSLLPLTRDLFQNAMSEFNSCFTDKGILTSAVGAAILGVGITLSGACPGMVLAQLGSWVPNSVFTLIGCLLGALSYGLVAPYLRSFSKPKRIFENKSVDQTLKWPYAAVALPMAVCLAVTIFLLEYFWDYEKDLKMIGRELPPYDNVITAVAWRPCVAGALIGLLQLPLVLTVKDTMGGSSSYVTIVSQWVVTKKLQEMFPYLAAKRCGVENWWQVLYVGGAILGAAITSIVTDTMASSYGPSVQTSICGGILMLWGARYASGCTSGHGLSGLGLLNWMSFLAVPCMFAGGIATGFAMKATGALYDLVEHTLDT